MRKIVDVNLASVAAQVFVLPRALVEMGLVKPATTKHAHLVCRTVHALQGNAAPTMHAQFSNPTGVQRGAG